VIRFYLRAVVTSVSMTLLAENFDEHSEGTKLQWVFSELQSIIIAH